MAESIEIIFTEDEVTPIVAGSSGYGRVIEFDESEAGIIDGRPAGYSEVIFDESEAEAFTAGPGTAFEVVFGDDEVLPIIGFRPYEVVFDESEVEPIATGDGPVYREPEGDPPVNAGKEPTYAGVLGPTGRGPARRRQRVDFTEPVVITGHPPRTGPVAVQPTAGLTDRHRRLLGKPVIAADPVERWGTREAGRALIERKLSRNGTSRFLAAYKDRWVRAHRKVIEAAAERYDLPPWVVAGVAWTEVGGDPEIQDEIAGLGLRPDRVSFGPVQMELRRAAEELGYDPVNMSAIQRRVLIWSLLDPQQNLFLVASHLDRLRDIEAPGRPAAELTDEDVRIIGARYNRGPELTLTEILTTKQRTKYGDDLLAKRERVQRLLSVGNAPAR